MTGFVIFRSGDGGGHWSLALLRNRLDGTKVLSPSTVRVTVKTGNTTE